MINVVGIFTSRREAEDASQRLQSVGITEEKTNFLVPGASESEIQSVPTTEAEAPGIGKTLGSLVGGVIGAAAGLQAGAVVQSILPGVGPVTAIGMAGAVLLGAAGALGGASAGAALEESVSRGLPVDELYLYEDALRKGRTVLILLADDEEQADKAREILIESGAENLDVARENWWIGLRAAEELKYTTRGADFSRDEPNFRRGFEAALQAEVRGKSYQEALETLKHRFPNAYRDEAFRHGFESGRAHYLELLERHTTKV